MEEHQIVRAKRDAADLAAYLEGEALDRKLAVGSHEFHVDDAGVAAEVHALFFKPGRQRANNGVVLIVDGALDAAQCLDPRKLVHEAM